MRLIILLATIAGMFIFFSDRNLQNITERSRVLEPTSLAPNFGDSVSRKIRASRNTEPMQVTAAFPNTPENKLLPTPASLSDRSMTLESLVDEAKIQIITLSPARYRYVTATRLNVRSNASTSAAIISKLNYGSRVEVVSETSQSWLEISLRDDAQVGFSADIFHLTNQFRPT